MSVTSCQCGFAVKAAANLRLKFGFTSRRPKVDGACPYCGLLPKGDRVAEYVLTIWFNNGNISEFTCRGGKPENRFRIAGNMIKIEMPECCVSFSLASISTFAFRGQVVPAVTPIALEVTEAERIIAGADKASG